METTAPANEIAVLGGDPDAIRASAARWAVFGAVAATESATVTAQGWLSGAEFLGTEGHQHSHRLIDLGHQLSTAGQAWDVVAAALMRFADQLEECQHRLRRLVGPAAPAGEPDSEATQGSDERDRLVRAVRAEHAAARRDCCLAIERATALAPDSGTAVGAVSRPAVLAVETASSGNGSAPAGRFSRLSMTSANLRLASTGSAGFAFRLEGGDADPPDPIIPVEGTTEDLRDRIFEHCILDNPPDGPDDVAAADTHCEMYADLAVEDAAAASLAVDRYPSAAGAVPPPRPYWDDMKVGLETVVGLGAEATGLVDCLEGDVSGCVAAVGFTLVGGVFATVVGRTTRAIKALSKNKPASAAGNSTKPGGRAAAKGRTTRKSDHGTTKNDHAKHHEPTVKKRAAEAEAARAQTVRDTLMPGGNPLGTRGSKPEIREMHGDAAEADAMFTVLRRGGTVVEDSAKRLRVELPDGGFVQLRRSMTKSPDTAITIDVKVPGLKGIVEKVKFNP